MSSDPRTWRVVTPPDWNGWALVETKPATAYYTEEADPLNPNGPKIKVRRERHGEVLRTKSGGPITFRTVEECQAYIDAEASGATPPAIKLDDLPPSSKFVHKDPPPVKDEPAKRKPRKPANT
jgi:hypothetical protein